MAECWQPEPPASRSRSSPPRASYRSVRFRAAAQSPSHALRSALSSHVPSWDGAGDGARTLDLGQPASHNAPATAHTPAAAAAPASPELRDVDACIAASPAKYSIVTCQGFTRAFSLLVRMTLELFSPGSGEAEFLARNRLVATNPVSRPAIAKRRTTSAGPTAV